ncbi:MAG TPA: alpha/beta hydrolase-fold protein [Planctomycetota bacterium]|nr:alpha/beta hydrolase-fold protein [Planctomycetota bacterium]
MRAALLLTLLAAGENWNNPPKNLPAGAEHKTFMSASMKVEVGYSIYLPAEYKDRPDKRYPVLYYLHGRGGTESSNLGAITLLDAAIKDGKVPPMIYVHAMGGRNSGYVDAPDGSVMGETAIIRELIPHIDATYRTIAKKEGRAVEGFSKGGQGALLFAFKFPEMFCSVIGSGAGLASGAELQKELPAVFKQMHGDDVAQFDSTSAWHFVRANADKLRKDMGISLGLGDKDQHLDRNRRMHKLLDELTIPHSYKELPGVGHDTGKVYKEIGVEGFEFHAKHFKLDGK